MSFVETSDGRTVKQLTWPQKLCSHSLGFPWSGEVPCTGLRLCKMCGAEKDSVDALPYLDEPMPYYPR